jgi:hypothetical protein
LITRNEVLPLLLSACPGFEQSWRAHVEWWKDGEPGIFNDTGEFAHYLVDRYAEGAISECETAFTVIETILRDGDEDAREAAVIGVLEDVQTIAANRPFGSDVFIPLLGPLSRRAWVEIDALWAAGGGSMAGVVRLERQMAAKHSRPPADESAPVEVSSREHR